MAIFPALQKLTHMSSAMTMSICRTKVVHVSFNIVPKGENLYPPSRQNEELWHPFSFSQSYKKQYTLTVHSKVQHLFFRYVHSFQEYANSAWHFGFETSRFRDFCQFLEGFGFGSGEFGLGKKARFQKTSLGISFGQIFGLVIQCIPIDHIWLADFPTVYFHQFCHGRQQAVVTSQMGVKNAWATISMRSDNLQLTCIQPPNSLQILPLRLFK